MRLAATLFIVLLLVPLAGFSAVAGNVIRDAEMAGYLFGPAEKVPEE